MTSKSTLSKKAVQYPFFNRCQFPATTYFLHSYKNVTVILQKIVVCIFVSLSIFEVPHLSAIALHFIDKLMQDLQTKSSKKTLLQIEPQIKKNFLFADIVVIACECD